MSYLGLKYEHVDINIIKGESQTDGFKSVNPVGQIPLLELSDGRRIAESNAIMYFLAEGTPYWPKNAFDQAKCLQWMFFEQYKWKRIWRIISGSWSTTRAMGAQSRISRSTPTPMLQARADLT